MAIALSKEKVQAKHSLMVIYSFFTLFLVNVLVVYLANFFFPAYVVLGTGTISYWWAVCHSMGKLALIGVAAMLLVTYYEWYRGKNFSPKEWMATYLVVNFVGLWAIARFATNLGLGLSSWVVALFLAAILDWVQGLAMMALGKYVK